MVKMLIGGEQTDATATDELEVIDPATEDVHETVPAGGVDAVELAVQAADGAFREWSKTDAEKRAEIIRKALDLVAEHKDEIVETLTHEQGKPTIEAAGELQHFIHGMHYYADLATKVRGAYQDLPSTLGRSYGMVDQASRRAGRGDRAVQLPADADGDEDRPCARCGQHRSRQAGVVHAARDAEGRRALPRGRAAGGRAQRRHGPRLGDRRCARHAPADSPRGVHRRDRYRQAHRRARRARASSGSRSSSEGPTR